MFGIFGIILLLLGLAGLIVLALMGQTFRNAAMSRGGWFAGAGVLAFLGLVITLFASYQSIGAGKVGIEYGPSGAIIGQMNGGGFLAPWDHVKQLDTRVQKAEYTNLAVFSKETIEGQADVTVNFHVNASDARKLIRTVGFNYVDTLIHSRVQNDVKDATVKFAAVDLAPHREDIRKAVALHLDQELTPYSIHVDAVQVNNIELPATITGPLADRQAAVINAQAAQNKVKQVEAEAKQTVAQAQGAAQAAVISAEGTAKANKAIAASVSTDKGYIDYLRAQALVALANNPNTKVIPSNVFFTQPTS